MTYKESLEKTAIVVQGIVKGINEFTPKDSEKTFYSVDLEIKGTRLPVTVKLSDEYDRSQLNDFELAKIHCCIRPTFDRKGIQLYAV